MTIDLDPVCQKVLEQIKRNNTPLFKKISKQLICFQAQPDHPSLRLHKLKGSMNDTWSISINRSVRMVFYYRQVKSEKHAVFIDVGTHKEVYK